MVLCWAVSGQAQHGRENQNGIHGMVVELFDGQQYRLLGANVYWAGTTMGTVTDSTGGFEIDLHPRSNQLVASFVGMSNDTIVITKKEEVKFILTTDNSLDDVIIEHRVRGMEISFTEPRKVEIISEKELSKAACCNLSESFETNPSVDVAFADPVTGTRQIQMLGLAGPYSQLTRENIPGARGIAAFQGLEYTPGPWVKSIQLSKGAGSVLNGYESVTGQINYELRKPLDREKWFLNGYINGGSRMEFNAVHNAEFSEAWSGNTFVHSKWDGIAMDRNGDNFLDMPIGNSLIGLQRIQFARNGWHIETMIKGVLMDRVSGQFGHLPGYLRDDTQPWGSRQTTQRTETAIKIGKVNTAKPYESIALQIAGSWHQQNNYFGLRDYLAKQRSLYANGIYQSILGNTFHTYKTGLSLQHDWVSEDLDSLHFWREEWVPGVFFEYTYAPNDDFTAVVGLRGDHHNHYGAFVTPRLHLRYALSEKSVIRASGGRGQRTASILAENLNYMASGRQFIIENSQSSFYGLQPEVAWNYGLNFTHEFELDFRPGRISVDVYRTDFINQIVVDLDASGYEVRFYNLTGKSYANSVQLQLDYELIRRLDVRMAYRWFDVHTTYGSGLLSKPLLNPHRAFVNLAYQTRNHWSFDYTLQVHGKKRIPFSEDKPLAYQLASETPVFTTSNWQITKVWRERFDAYIGMENALNFKQSNPIVAADTPYSKDFDASQIWGPVFGRVTYLGFRYRIDKE